MVPVWLDCADYGRLPYKSDGDDHRIISRQPRKRTRILCYERVPDSFPPQRGIKSTIANDITDTAHFNSNKDNCQTLSSQRLSEGIVIHPGRTP